MAAAAAGGWSVPAGPRARSGVGDVGPNQSQERQRHHQAQANPFAKAAGEGAGVVAAEAAAGGGGGGHLGGGGGGGAAIRGGGGGPRVGAGPRGGGNFANRSGGRNYSGQRSYAGRIDRSGPRASRDYNGDRGRYADCNRGDHRRYAERADNNHNNPQ